MTSDLDGQMYVLDQNAPFIHVFGRDGKFIRVWGRAGGGPGEFRQPMYLGWHGDTLVVVDPPLMRISLFNKAGHLVRTIPIRPQLQLSSRSGFPVTLLAAGTVLVASSTEEQPGTANAVFQESLLAADPANRTTKIIAMFERHNFALRVAVRVNGEPGMMNAVQPFSNDPLWRVDRNGTAVVWVERPQMTREPTFTVTRVTQSGDTVFSRRIAYIPKLLDDPTLDGAVRQVGDLPLPSSVKMVIDNDALRKEIYRPKYLPPVSGITAASDGTTWIRLEQEARSDQVIYLVLRPDGSTLGEFSSRKTEQVVEARVARIWTRNITFDDGAYVHLYLASKRHGQRLE